MQSHPYHGVVLTANGALQRTMSAWYQSEIKVEVIFNREIQEMISWAHPFVKQYDRRVQMSCCGEDPSAFLPDRRWGTELPRRRAPEACSSGVTMSWRVAASSVASARTSAPIFWI